MPQTSIVPETYLWAETAAYDHRTGPGSERLMVFDNPLAAIQAAADLIRSVSVDPPVACRIALDVGEAPLSRTHGLDESNAPTGKMRGRAVRCMHLASIAHNRQVLLTKELERLARDVLPKELAFRSLGVQRLPDLAPPVEVFQVVHPKLPDDFPPPKTLDTLPNNLPLLLTRLVGRRQEISQLKDLIGESRLITLVGTGGSGKTRLALHAAAERVPEFADGVWLVQLDKIADPAEVPRAIAETLGMVDDPAFSSSLAALQSKLAEKHLLLLLDNCEHLIGGAAEVVEALLAACPRLSVLATSREALGIVGETLYPVQPMRVPSSQASAENIARSEAVRLFVDRARSNDPFFQLNEDNIASIAEICRRLDGLPLAVELAAARIRTFSPQEIVARLDDRFRLLTRGRRTALPRQQTLRGTVEWSFNLLTPKEQVLLRRLSVFTGGFIAEAAEAVCSGEEVARDEVLGLLGQLVDRSLVLAETGARGTRYRLLETIRQYGAEKAKEAGEEEPLRDRHRRWCLSFAEEGNRGLNAHQYTPWLSRLEAEMGNFRAAFAYSLERARRRSDGSEDGDIGLRLAQELGFFGPFAATFRRGLSGCRNSSRSRRVPLGHLYVSKPLGAQPSSPHIWESPTDRSGTRPKRSPKRSAIKI